MKHEILTIVSHCKWCTASLPQCLNIYIMLGERAMECLAGHRLPFPGDEELIVHSARQQSNTVYNACARITLPPPPHPHTQRHLKSRGHDLDVAICRSWRRLYRKSARHPRRNWPPYDRSSRSILGLPAHICASFLHLTRGLSVSV